MTPSDAGYQDALTDNPTAHDYASTASPSASAHPQVGAVKTETNVGMGQAPRNMPPTALSPAAAYSTVLYATEERAVEVEDAKVAASTTEDRTSTAQSAPDAISSTTLLSPVASSQPGERPYWHFVTKLNNIPYVFGTFDVGSLDLGPNSVAHSTLYIGYFRKDDFARPTNGWPEPGGWNGQCAIDSGDYYGCPASSTEPRYYDEASGTARRHADAIENAGTLMKLPWEIRNAIYEMATLPARNMAEQASLSKADGGESDCDDYYPCSQWASAQSLSHISTTSSVTATTYVTSPSTAMISNLQLTCRRMYDEVSAFAYQHHAFFFCQPNDLSAFLDYLAYRPVPYPNKGRFFGTVVVQMEILPECSDDDSRKVDARPSFNVEDWMTRYVEENRNQNWRVYWKKRNYDQRRARNEWAIALGQLIERHRVQQLLICHEGSVWELRDPVCRTLKDFRGIDRVTEFVSRNGWVANDEKPPWPSRG